MAPISAPVISASLERAFGAAFLLTGSFELAENAVLKGIALLDCNEDIEKALLAKTVQSVLQQHVDRSPQVEHSPAVPPEFQRLLQLELIARGCFLLRVLCGMTAGACAAILNLTVQDFERSLCAAFERLPGPPLQSASVVGKRNMATPSVSSSGSG